MNGKIEIDRMITHILKLEDINKGFDLIHSGESIRSVVVYQFKPSVADATDWRRQQDVKCGLDQTCCQPAKKIPA